MIRISLVLQRFSVFGNHRQKPEAPKKTPETYEQALRQFERWCLDAMAEDFFSILKTECIYRHKPKTSQESNDLIDQYVIFTTMSTFRIKLG